MCGIVGRHLRNPDLHPRLGELLTATPGEMANGGSESAGEVVHT
jgi:methylamine---glutamate N-methyltransferase subunit A